MANSYKELVEYNRQLLQKITAQQCSRDTKATIQKSKTISELIQMQEVYDQISLQKSTMKEHLKAVYDSMHIEQKYLEREISRHLDNMSTTSPQPPTAPPNPMPEQEPESPDPESPEPESPHDPQYEYKTTKMIKCRNCMRVMEFWEYRLAGYNMKECRCPVGRENFATFTTVLKKRVSV